MPRLLLELSRLLSLLRIRFLWACAQSANSQWQQSNASLFAAQPLNRGNELLEKLTSALVLTHVHHS